MVANLKVISHAYKYKHIIKISWKLTGYYKKMSNQTKRQNAIKFLILFETSANIREKELYMIMFLDTCQSIIDKKLIN